MPIAKESIKSPLHKIVFFLSLNNFLLELFVIGLLRFFFNFGVANALIVFVLF